MENKTDTVFHGMSTKKGAPYISPALAILFIVVILAGIGTGYAISHMTTPTITATQTTAGGKIVGGVQVGAIYGSDDTKTFKDTAQGVLQAGGIDGEGQYHLVRPGGDSQNVYMTSSIVDLSQFIGRTIKVWGQTQAAQHAGWLMDVGRVQIVK